MGLSGHWLASPGLRWQWDGVAMSWADHLLGWAWALLVMDSPVYGLCWLWAVLTLE